MTEKKKKEDKKEHCVCPYCDETIVSQELPFCQPCGIKFIFCPHCEGPVAKRIKTCPRCGANL